MKKCFVLITGLWGLWSCTTKSDTYYNRQFRKIPTKYNVLYNGNLALKEGVAAIQKPDAENYFEILPVEPLVLDVEGDGAVKENPLFVRAEEKAIKAIQKHSMVFNGKQKNARIDDAYMLLGKARFYNRRYIPALEAFNHLLYNYGETNRKGEAMLWREKVHMQLGRERLAVENLEKHLRDSLLKKDDVAYLKALQAQGLVADKKMNEAVLRIKEASKLVKKKAVKGRYLFITAQIYEKIGQKDSAVAYFDKVVALNRRIPRRLWMEAQIARARNVDASKTDVDALIKKLIKQEKVYENKVYLASLYFAHASLLEQKADTEFALVYYLKSLKENKGNVALKEKAHFNVANLYFAQKEFTKAYHHYDSTLAFIPANKLEHLYIKRKRDNLAEIARYDAMVTRADSLIKLTSLTNVQKRELFDQMQKADKKTTQANAQGIASNVEDFGSLGGQRSFYFYNAQAVAYGKEQFEKEFGRQPLVDNWKYATEILSTDPQIEKTQANNTTDTAYDAFVKTLPSTLQVSSFNNEKNKALLWLGQTYWDKFKEQTLAQISLKKVLENNPTSDQEQIALFYLYKTHQLTNLSMAEQYKAILEQKYASGMYARALRGENIATENAFMADTEKIKELLSSGNYKAAIALIEEKQAFYALSNNIETWELMLAQAKGRLEGLSAYKAMLEELQNKYPKNEAYKKIIEVLPEVTIPFIKEAPNGAWKIVIRHAVSYELKRIKQWLESHGQAHVKVTFDAYNYGEDFVVLHGFYNLNEVNAMFFDLSEYASFLQGRTLIVINTDNYLQVQRNKSIDDYQKWFKDE